jgi:hypothetical protein
MSRGSKHASESAAAALAAPQRSGPRKSKQPPVQRKPPVHGRESHAERWGQGKLLPSSPQMPRRHWQGGPAGPATLTWLAASRGPKPTRTPLIMMAGPWVVSVLVRDRVWSARAPAVCCSAGHVRSLGRSNEAHQRCKRPDLSHRSLRHAFRRGALGAAGYATACPWRFWAEF